MTFLLQSLQALLFPPACISCGDCLSTPRHVFCADCLAALVRLDARERCPVCFQLLEAPQCFSCKESCAGFRIAGVFLYDSPASALLKQLKYGAREELAPTMASWMVVQFNELNFPWPDAIISVPQSFPRRIVRGYNPNKQLASAMSELMRVPLLRPLRRTWTALPQAGKDADERTSMSHDEFSLHSAKALADKNILLIDDVITTGTTIKRCVEALQPSFPRSLNALGFCLA